MTNANTTKILYYLNDGAFRSALQVARATHIAKTTVMSQLQRLEQQNIVECRHQGNVMLWRNVNAGAPQEAHDEPVATPEPPISMLETSVSPAPESPSERLAWLDKQILAMLRLRRELIVELARGEGLSISEPEGG